MRRILLLSILATSVMAMTGCENAEERVSRVPSEDAKSDQEVARNDVADKSRQAVLTISYEYEAIPQKSRGPRVYAYDLVYLEQPTDYEYQPRYPESLDDDQPTFPDFIGTRAQLSVGYVEKIPPTDFSQQGYIEALQVTDGERREGYLESVQSSGFRREGYIETVYY